MRILLADAHILCREALGAFIMNTDHAMDVRGVSDYDEMAAAIQDAAPDILLIDSELPGLPAPDPHDALSRYPALRYGIILPYDRVPEALDARGAGVFSRALSCKGFMQGIEEIIGGRMFVPAASQLYAHTAPPAHVPPAASRDFALSPRERQVLGFLLTGATNKDIARALDLQVVTVKLHVRGICRKMNAKNRTQAALIARESGLDVR